MVCMSGIVGHTLYALLGLRAAEARKLPVVGILHRHLAGYLAGIPVDQGFSWEELTRRWRRTVP